MLTDFQNSFTGTLNGKFATNPCLNITPHLNYAATLPCEMSVYKMTVLQKKLKKLKSQIAMQDLAIQKSFVKYLSGKIFISYFSNKKTFTSAI